MARSYLFVDGNNILHRAYHAKKRTMSPDAPPEQAVAQTVRQAMSMIETARMAHSPHVTVVTFDGGGDALGRSEVYPNYKAKRLRLDDDRKIINLAITEAHSRMVVAPATFVLSVPGYESDDVIATLAATAESRSESAVLMSNDKDLLQCLSPFVSVRQPQNGGGYTLTTPQDFKGKYGYDYQYLPTYKALAGDESDSIGGVPKIGPVHAIRLIEQYGDLDDIYESIQFVMPRDVRNRLIENFDLPYTCLKISTVCRTVPIGANLLGHVFR